jgi:hypothetical protein
MKESYGEGVACHTGPKSCAGGGNSVGEALTGVRTGSVLSREIPTPPRGGSLRGADALDVRGRQHLRRCHGEALRDPARSQTRNMYGTTLRGNREIPRASGVDEAPGRIGKSKDARR